MSRKHARSEHSNHVANTPSRRLEAADTSALRKPIELGDRDLRAGRVKPIEEVVARLRAKSTRS